MSAVPNRRSPWVLAGVVALAVGAGAAATLFKPDPQPSVSATGSISMPVAVPESTPDAAASRAQLIEQLVADARTEPRPDLLPEYEAVVIPCRRGQASCEPLLARLREADVPLSLVARVARELPRSGRQQLDSLLLPLLRSGEPERQWAAVAAYREAKRAAVGSDTACGCGFGILPTPLTGEAWLFAERPTGGGLAWSPTEGETQWTLGLVRADDGVPRLLQRVEARERAQILAHEGGATVRVTTSSAH